MQEREEEGIPSPLSEGTDMPDYKTGTYITKPRKIWNCEHCGKVLPTGQATFTRVKEYGDERTRDSDGETYRKKKYKRYHISCATKLNDLTPHEIALLGTGAGMNALDQIIEQMKQKGFNIVYQDTDSIFFKKDPITP